MKNRTSDNFVIYLNMRLKAKNRTDESKEKIKPILYYDVEDKNKIEAKLAAEIPEEERSLISLTLMDIFVNIRRHPFIKSK